MLRQSRGRSETPSHNQLLYKSRVDRLKVFTQLSTRRPLRFYINLMLPPGDRDSSSSSITLKINFKFEAATFRKQRLPEITKPPNSRRNVVRPEIIDA